MISRIICPSLSDFTSLSIIFSRTIYVTANGNFSLFVWIIFHVHIPHLISWLCWVLAVSHGVFHLPCSMCDFFSCSLRTLSCNTWDLVPWPRIEPRSPASGVRSLNCWTTRKVPVPHLLKDQNSNSKRYMHPNVHSSNIDFRESVLISVPKSKTGWWVIEDGQFDR